MLLSYFTLTFDRLWTIFKLILIFFFVFDFFTAPSLVPFQILVKMLFLF